MKKYNLLDDDIFELENFAKYLSTHHIDIFLKGYKYGAMLKNASVLKRTDLLGAILGYRGKTVYDIIQSQKINIKGLDYFFSRYEKLENLSGLSEEDKNQLNQAKILFFKIKSQEIYGHSKYETKENNKTIKLFANTHWYIYERFLNSIGRKIIRFSEEIKDGNINVEVQTIDTAQLLWKGKAYCDSTNDYLLIQTYNDEFKSQPTQYMLRIDSKALSISLCIGQMTFATRVNRNVITKNVVLQIITKKEEQNATEFFYSDESVRANIPQEIWRYLDKREQNRLPTPHKSVIITSPDALKKWHKENDELKKELWNEKINGKYFIYYSRSNSEEKPRKDELEIYYNVHADIIAKYKHEFHGKQQTWKGDVVYSAITRALFITLKGPKLKSNYENISPIFLILNIPYGNRDFSALTGIISGIRDEFDGAIGLMALAIARTDVNNKNISEAELKDLEEKIENYFNLDRINFIIKPEMIAEIKELGM